jgi:hypothetical protein
MEREMSISHGCDIAVVPCEMGIELDLVVLVCMVFLLASEIPSIPKKDNGNLMSFVAGEITVQ